MWESKLNLDMKTKKIKRAKIKTHSVKRAWKHSQIKAKSINNFSKNPKALRVSIRFDLKISQLS